MIGGIGAAYVLDSTELEVGMKYFASVDKHGLLAIFVPILLFEPALKAHYHYFTQIMGQVAVLAFPVLLITAGLSAIGFHILIGKNADINWYGAYTLGILVSITDPVETINRLNQKRASHKFITLIELEALTNDATGIIFFNFFS